MCTPKASTAFPKSTVKNHPPINIKHLTPFRLPLRARRSRLKTKASVTSSKCHSLGQGVPETPGRTHAPGTGA